MEENRLQQCASCYLNYTTPNAVCQAVKKTFDICSSKKKQPPRLAKGRDEPERKRKKGELE